MDCQEVHKFVHAYLDGEFAEDDRVAFATHLASCEPCSRIARFEERFKEKLRGSEPERSAPPRLRARIEGVLAQEAQQQQRRERRKRWTWRLVPALAAAAIVGALGITFGLRAGEQQMANPMTLAEQSVRWHRRKLPLDVTDSQGDAIRRFFRDKVPFAVRLPRFANPNAKLVGARLTQLHGNEAVYLTYQVGKQRVSVFVVDPRALPTHDRRIHWRGVRGYNVGTFVSDGTGYAVTSEMDRGRLVRLISHAE